MIVAAIAGLDTLSNPTRGPGLMWKNVNFAPQNNIAV